MWVSFTDQLDCSGVDSGNDECWSQGLNIGIPVGCTVLFLLLLAIMYAIKPKIPAEDKDLVADYNTLSQEVEELRKKKATEMTFISTANSMATLVERV